MKEIDVTDVLWSRNAIAVNYVPVVYSEEQQNCFHLGVYLRFTEDTWESSGPLVTVTKVENQICFIKVFKNFFLKGSLDLNVYLCNLFWP
jgi:hypothetical protein